MFVSREPAADEAMGDQAALRVAGESEKEWVAMQGSLVRSPDISEPFSF